MNLRLKSKKNQRDLFEETIPSLDKTFKKATEYYFDLYNHVYSFESEIYGHYLGCRTDEFYLVDLQIEKGTDILYASMIDKVIEENYKINNDVAVTYLQTWIGKNGFQLYDYENLKKKIGFNRVSLSTGGNQFVEYIDSANCFIEDENGFKFVLHIPKPYGLLNISNSTYKVILLANSNIPGGREACGSFVNKSYKRLREMIKIKGCALNQKGLPVDVGHLSWDNLKIPAILKKEIDFHIMDFISHIDEFKAAGVKSSRGIIIAGSPGNGKTMLAKILCSNTEAAFFLVGPKDFINQYPEPTIGDLYRTASNFAPAIVLIEDADIFLQKRTFNNNSGTLSEFLNIIDGIKENDGIITILTCNNPELLDEAVKNRPKRFDVIIEFPNPALEQRREILIDKLQKFINPDDLLMIDEAAVKFEGFSGAHICEFCERLIMSKIYSGKEFIDFDIFNTEITKFGFSPSVKKGNIGIR